MTEWLTTIAMKDQIWGLVKNKIPKEKVYHLDEYDEQHGHCVLRLPPYHCHFNTIEMVWSETKRHYDANIKKTSSTATEVLNIWTQAIERVIVSHGKSYVQHTERVILSAWETENCLTLKLMS
ncbi:hypothetical protein ILUMI_14955 [Ignelater luminosus]|uniref:Uncharacterized protein n=1 Tax=Ignelater luminosus TaxID=2038154 RepID=A0A8K0CPJ2_IGNLU|nr:hypothetical protein ILUMI_14955 [Ignelater luminosus]